jgi:hypothetical protein
MLQGVETAYRSQLPGILSGQGYQIENYSIFDLKGYPTLGKPLFNSLAERLIDEQTLWGRFRRYLLWNFTVKKFGTGKLRVTPAVLKLRNVYAENFVSQNIAGLEAVSKIQTSAPVFAYCHIMLPHSPYYFNAKGGYLPDSTLFDQGGAREKFIEQTRYANIVIGQLLNVIMKERVRPYTIIIQGDHGFRDFPDPADRNRIFENLNTFYFSDGDYHLLYDSISSVNTFRVILNKYFGQQYKMLPDSSVYLRDPSFEFEKKTR